MQLNHPDIQEVLVTADQIRERIAELAKEIDAFYAEKNLLLIGVLKGAVPFMADLSRAMSIPVTQDWMAVSSYGSGTVSSGVVRILKDLDADVKDRNVLIVEDIIDSGLTLSWLTANLKARGAASVEIVTLLRKPDAAKVEIAVRWVGFDIPNAFVVGYGLDYDERYRSLDGVGVLSPSVYS
ncbi:MAG: hypoxanthine phosphoribosyltransferase [Actinomycetota bacterium]